jgi:hypothetical protein
VKTTVREAFSFFVEDDSVSDRFRDFVDRWLYEIVLAIIFAAATLMLCGCTAVSCFAFNEKSSTDEAGVNPYRRSVHRSACCTWCCAFLYAIIAFFIGGLLYALSVPLSSTCLVMDDVNSQMLKDIAPAVGIDMDVHSEQFSMVGDIIDKCFNPENPSENANLLDLLIVQDGNKSNETVSMRTRISAQMQEQIVSKFDMITQTLNNLSVPSLANNSAVINLRSLLIANPIDALILPDRERLVEDDAYKAIALDSRGPDGLQIGFATSMSCVNHTVDAELASLVSSETIPGIDTFVSKLAFFGTLSDSSTCAEKVVNCGGQNSDAVICEAGNNYMDLKQGLLLSSQYRCDLFEDPHNSTQFCDPSLMTNAHGTWINDCLDPVTKRAKIKQRNCTLQEFVAYVHNSSAAIDKVLGRVDFTVPQVKEIINVEMRGVVNNFLIDPVTEIVDGVTCGFVAATYQGLIDGLCYQGVVGFNTIARSYVACAALSFILILVAFVLWCRGVNNVNAWEANERERKTLETRTLHPVGCNV